MPQKLYMEKIIINRYPEIIIINMQKLYMKQNTTHSIMHLYSETTQPVRGILSGVNFKNKTSRKVG